MCPVCNYYDCVCNHEEDRRIAIRKRVVDLYVGIMVAKELGNDEWYLLRIACFDAFNVRIPKTCNDIDSITKFLQSEGFIP